MRFSCLELQEQHEPAHLQTPPENDRGETASPPAAASCSHTTPEPIRRYTLRTLPSLCSVGSRSGEHASAWCDRRAARLRAGLYSYIGVLSNVGFTRTSLLWRLSIRLTRRRAPTATPEDDRRSTASPRRYALLTLLRPARGHPARRAASQHRLIRQVAIAARLNGYHNYGSSASALLLFGIARAARTSAPTDPPGERPRRDGFAPRRCVLLTHYSRANQKIHTPYTSVPLL